MKQVVLAKDNRQHRLIGFGLAWGRPSDKTKTAASCGYGWLFLNFHDSIQQIIPGLHGNAQSIDLAGSACLAPNLAGALNWKAGDVRRWVSALAEQWLITERLALALYEQTSARRVCRDAIPKATRAAVLAKTSGKCVYCGVVLVTVDGLDNSYCADHVLPVTKGGGDDIANLIPSCRACNGRKGAKTMLQFVGEIRTHD